MDSALNKTVAKYVKSALYTRIIKLVYAYIKPRFLSPELMGLWNLLNIIVDLASYSHLGSRASIKYLIPPLEEENKLQEVQDIKGAVYYGTYYVALLIVIGVLTVAYFSEYSIEQRVGLVAVAVLILLTWQYEYYTAVLKATQQFTVVINSNYIMSSARLILGVVLMYYFNIYGLLAAILFSTEIVVIYIKYKYPNDIRNKFKFQVYKKLVRSGIGILLFNYSLTTLIVTNRFVISYFLGLEQLGLYSIAMIVADIIMQIPGSSREVIEPKVAQLMDNQPIEKTLTDYYFKPMYTTAYYCPFLVFGVFFALPPAVGLLLPRYMEGVLAAQVLVFGTVFLGLSYATRVFIILNNKQLKSIFLILLALGVNIFASIFFIQNLNYGIAGVALATVIANAALFLMLYISVAHIYKEMAYGYHLFYLILPFVLSILIIPTTYSLINNTIICKYLYNDYILAAIEIILSSFIMYCVIMLLEKNNAFIYYTLRKLK